MAGRTSHLCDIFRDVFAGQEQRLRCLISPQTGWRDLAETVLDCPAWVEATPGARPCHESVDAVNVTGYFAGCLADYPEVVSDWLEQGSEAALDLAFEQLEHGGLIEECSGEQEDSLDFTIEGYDYFMSAANARNLDLYVYESGTHFEYSEDDEIYSLLSEMTRDERMYDLYRKNFRGFRQAGGDILNVWGWIAPDDLWANAEFAGDRSHPKYRAILDFVADGHQ
jgi:hypothetical protein